MDSSITNQIIVDTSWQEALEEVLKSNTTIIIGGVNCGKSTFAKYLIKKVLQQRGDLVFIDADIGQSSIAVPGTIGLKKISNPSEADKFADQIFFVGYTTPSVSIEYFLEVFTKAVESCRIYNLPIVVDTDGFIAGDGISLKLKEIEILMPDLIIAFQKENELESIIKAVDTKTIILRPSSHIKVRDQKLRAEYRLKRFKSYFKNSESYIMPVKMIKDSKDMKNLIYNSDNLKGTIIGLMSEKQCTGVGLIEDIDSKTVVIRTPISDINKVKKILIGKIKLSEIK